MKSLIKVFSQVLNQPFPDSDDFKSLAIGAIGIGLFVTLFLYAFAPFGLPEGHRYLLPICISFGLVSLTVSIVFELVLTRVIKISRENRKWTFSKWLISTVVLIFIISVANFFLYLLITGDVFSFERLAKLVYNTFLIGIFPVILIGSVRIASMRRYFERIADSYQKSEEGTKDDYVVTISKSAKTVFQVQASELAFVQALQNYAVFVVVQDGSYAKEIIRLTLKEVEDQLKPGLFIKCHRSYIVNINHIKKVSGNAQGLQLSMKDSGGLTVPVSRKYVHLFRN